MALLIDPILMEKIRPTRQLRSYLHRWESRQARWHGTVRQGPKSLSMVPSESCSISLQTEPGRGRWPCVRNLAVPEHPAALEDSALQYLPPGAVSISVAGRTCETP